MGARASGGCEAEEEKSGTFQGSGEGYVFSERVRKRIHRARRTEPMEATVSSIIPSQLKKHDDDPLYSRSRFDLPPEIVRLVHIHLLGRCEWHNDVLLELEDLVRLELEEGVFGGARGLVVHRDFDFVKERFVEDWEAGQRQQGGHKLVERRQ